MIVEIHWIGSVITQFHCTTIQLKVFFHLDISGKRQVTVKNYNEHQCKLIKMFDLNREITAWCWVLFDVTRIAYIFHLGAMYEWHMRDVTIRWSQCTGSVLQTFHFHISTCRVSFEITLICEKVPSVSVPPYYYWYILRYFRLLQLFVTIIYNLFILRPVEVMIGWIRTVVIFFASGIAGSLASAIFLPYLVSVSKHLFFTNRSLF